MGGGVCDERRYCSSSSSWGDSCRCRDSSPDTRGDDSGGTQNDDLRSSADLRLPNGELIGLPLLLLPLLRRLPSFFLNAPTGLCESSMKVESSASSKTVASESNEVGGEDDDAVAGVK